MNLSNMSVPYMVGANFVPAHSILHNSLRRLPVRKGAEPILAVLCVLKCNYSSNSELMHTLRSLSCWAPNLRQHRVTRQQHITT